MAELNKIDRLDFGEIKQRSFGVCDGWFSVANVYGQEALRDVDVKEALNKLENVKLDHGATLKEKEEKNPKVKEKEEEGLKAQENEKKNLKAEELI